MTLSQGFTTILGGFLLPFAILVLWGRLVESLGLLVVGWQLLSSLAPFGISIMACWSP